jgi:hexosaminidase
MLHASTDGLQAKNNCTFFKHYHKWIFGLFLVPVFSFVTKYANAQSPPTTSIIPAPVWAHMRPGNFLLSAGTTISWNDPADSLSAVLFNEQLSKYYHYKVTLHKNATQSTDVIRLLRSSDNSLPKEGYSLIVTEKLIIIKGDDAGIFYGLQTILQFLPASATDQQHIPCCDITDYPRYSWRGMHLDVSRHFFNKEEVKQYLDYMAAFKMNTFHWHLTDDQGWRIEIKKYPLLTHVGAWRKGTRIGHYSTPLQFDTIRYGGYYTQKEVSEIVEYAAKRKITIVPEIEMPGHSMAALAAYPELACSSKSYAVARNWGTMEDVMCPTPLTIKMMKEVLDEVMSLFPSSYIHIGGDECPKKQWELNTYCQQLKKEKGFKTENELQSWFTEQIAQYLNSKDRTAIGWDEIMEGGMPANAAVMSWRGTKSGIDAATLGHPVVMAPTSYCYFDYYQSQNPGEPLAIGGYLPVDKVYSFEPTPAELNTAHQKFILGAQANLWTEYIPDFTQLQYMLFPRLCAMAEVCWTPKDKKNYSDFAQRLIQFQFPKFDLWGVNYSKALSGLTMELRRNDDGSALIMRLSSGDRSNLINYNLSSYESEILSATNNTTFEKGPLDVLIKNSVIVNAVSKDANGRQGPELVREIHFNKATAKNVMLAHEPDGRYNKGGAFTLVDGISGRIPWNGSEWLGFSGNDLTATIDLGSKQALTKVKVGLLDDQGSWIYLPKLVEIKVSNDGNTFTSAGKKNNGCNKKSGGKKSSIHPF